MCTKETPSGGAATPESPSPSGAYEQNITSAANLGGVQEPGRTFGEDRWIGEVS